MTYIDTNNPIFIRIPLLFVFLAASLSLIVYVQYLVYLNHKRQYIIMWNYESNNNENRGHKIFAWNDCNLIGCAVLAYTHTHTHSFYWRCCVYFFVNGPAVDGSASIIKAPG